MKQILKAALAGAFCFIVSSALGDTISDIRIGLKTLHQVQDEIAMGVPDASQMQSAILNQLTISLEKTPQSILNTHDYQSVLMELALSGGDLKRVLKLIRNSLSDSQDNYLLTGIDAYLDGRMADAVLAFEKAENSEHDYSGFDHFLALAKGTACLETDLRKARLAFEKALQLAPGTLVEEVALRRLVRISLKQQDPDLFVRAAILYIRRYANSPFAPETLSDIPQGVRLIADPRDIARLVDTVSILSSEPARNLLATLATVLLADGKVEFVAAFTAHLKDYESFGKNTRADLNKIKVLELLAKLKEKAGPESLLFLHEIGDSNSDDLLEIAKHVLWNIYRPLNVNRKSKDYSGEKSSNIDNAFFDVDLTLKEANSFIDHDISGNAP